jgi:hypothetical protein
LDLDIEARDPRDKTDEWHFAGHSMSIIARCYMTSSAGSWFHGSNELVARMMDTTWHVMAHDVTSILVVLKWNTDAPVAFPLGPIMRSQAEVKN